jgi:glycyl-tRNA synthetase beta chain
MAKDLLFEIGTEEIPARFMPGALAQLAENAAKALNEARITYSELKTYGTPRRLALIVTAVEEMQADRVTRKKGPSAKVAFDAAGQPSKALEGFARSSGVTVVDLVNEEGYMYAVLQETGKPVADLLPGILLQLVETQNFPKNMRWGDLDFKFVRPIHWLVALYGQEIVPISVAGITAGNVSKGHRILGSDQIKIANAAEYQAKMAANFVIVDQEQRRELIRRQVEAIALEQGGTATIDDELLEEVLYLVEYPTALCGSFDEKYLELPSEAIITPMREHQRYFPVFSKEGRLQPVFITVRNGGTDHIDNVRHGNERVLRARLADARFFFEEDRKLPLIDRVDKLKTIVFQEGLGTMYDKVQRLRKLSVLIGTMMGLDAARLAEVDRAAELAKADLVTGMVCEFTELQGVMGREYAKLSGESDVVADAVFEHYLPRFAGDILPHTPAGRAVAIADKIDNIVTTFSRGKIPTGSQDPYALRRQALGVVNIQIDGKLSLSTVDIVLAALDLIGIQDEEKRTNIVAAMNEFFKQRLNVKNVLGDAGVRHDVIEAVLSAGNNNVYQVWLRANAIMTSEGMSAMEKAVEGFTRAANLAKKSENQQVDLIDESLFEVAEEKALYAAYQSARTRIDGLTQKMDYVGALQVVAEISAPVDAFFAAVMVMVDDVKVRDNRLALLRAITGLTAGMVDLSKIVPAAKA